MGVSKQRIKGELEFMDDAAPMDERERERLHSAINVG